MSCRAARTSLRAGSASPAVTVFAGAGGEAAGAAASEPRIAFRDVADNLHHATMVAIT